MIENFELRLPGRVPERCYVHEIAGYVSLSTANEDWLCRPESLKPFRRMVTKREQVGEEETFRPDRQTLEAIRAVNPVYAMVSRDATPTPEVLGKPIVVGDEVTLSVDDEQQARGVLNMLNDSYVMIGDQYYHWSDEVVISRDA